MGLLRRVEQALKAREDAAVPPSEQVEQVFPFLPDATVHDPNDTQYWRNIRTWAARGATKAIEELEQLEQLTALSQGATNDTLLETSRTLQAKSELANPQHDKKLRYMTPE